MPSLQKKINYQGNPNTAPVTNIYLEFEIPVYKYTDDGENIVRETVYRNKTLSIEQAINSTDYFLCQYK